MSFYFKQDEAVAHGVRRIAHHQIDRVIRALTGRTRLSRDKAVHDARKRVKRLRAVLRLLRETLGDKTFHRENSAYRQASRPLSALRDAAVLITTLDNLLHHFKTRISKREFRDIRERLTSAHKALAGRSNGPGFTKIVRDLRQAKKRIDRWHFTKPGWDALCGGLRRSYRDGRQAMTKALRKPKAEALHEWRKRIKDLRYHAELLEEAWPEEIGKLAADAHLLSNLLGEDHDLVVLHETLLESPKDASLAPLTALIDARRAELFREAKPLGKRLYGEKPRAFEKRLHIYWQAWRKDEPDAVPAR